VELTSIGRMMARIPLDPRLARMLIEARKEGCVEEIAVIAAVLSLQDPRERPADKRRGRPGPRRLQPAALGFPDAAGDLEPLPAGAAGTEERRPDETLLPPHFLSFTRMREWEDIHQQIREILKEFGIRNRNSERWSRNQDKIVDTDAIPPEVGENSSPFPLPPSAFPKVHRCILSGFLATFAFKKDKNLYRAAKGPRGHDFSGSGLFNAPAAGSWRRDGGDLPSFRTDRSGHRPRLAGDPGAELCAPPTGIRAGSQARARWWPPSRSRSSSDHRSGPDVSIRPNQTDEATGHLHPQALVPAISAGPLLSGA